MSKDAYTRLMTFENVASQLQGLHSWIRGACETLPRADAHACGLPVFRLKELLSRSAHLACGTRLERTSQPTAGDINVKKRTSP
jgi:hypothetical protein